MITIFLEISKLYLQKDKYFLNFSFFFLDDVITLSDHIMVQSNGGVSKSTNDFLDSDDDDDIELVVVRPKSKSRVPRPLSPLSYEKHDGIEFITKQLGSETQMALTSKTGYIKVLFKRSLVSNG